MDEAHASSQLLNVVIRFSPAVAKRAAETRWHPSQETEFQPDGSLLWRATVAGMREKCLAAGMDDYLTKPFTSEDMESMIRKWAVPAAGKDALVDASRLAAFDDGTPKGRENTRRLVEMFLESTRESLERIRADHGGGDAQALAKSLHRLKGSCATVGAVAMADKLKQMEASLRRAGVGALDGDIVALPALFALTGKALDHLPERSLD